MEGNLPEIKSIVVDSENRTRSRVQTQWQRRIILRIKESEDTSQLLILALNSPRRDEPISKPLFSGDNHQLITGWEEKKNCRRGHRGRSNLKVVPEN